jgi:prephenate dehydrogenase/chorismate mutase
MDDLSLIRKQIDAVDRDIITLLERRLSLVRKVAKIKNNKQEIPFTDAVREENIIRDLQKRTNDMVLQDTISDVYKVIFSISKSVRHLVKEKDCPFSHVGIIGDGLIGRSIANAIYSKVDTRVKVTIHNREWKVEDYSMCDLVIIAAPIDTVIDIATSLSKNRKSLRPGVVIIDVASVKDKIAKKFAQLNNPHLGTAPIFVPTHPMGGRQERGSTYAQAILFAGRPWIITPVRSAKKETLDNVSTFVAYCGSRPIIVDAEQHDRLVTYVSHFPGILSQLLVDFVSDKEQESLRFAGSGFEMMTRIGKSKNIRMRSQIALSNAQNIHEVFDAFIHYIQQQDLQKWRT